MSTQDSANTVGATAWTGQPIVDGLPEFVVCATCKLSQHPIGLRNTAWYDPYVDYADHKGAYVHYSCISDKRRLELDVARLGEQK